MPDILVQVYQTNHLAVRDGFVEVPGIDSDKQLTLDNALSAVPGSTYTVFMGRKFFVLPQFERSVGYIVDWYKELRDASSLNG
jgi:hypothetical protein